MVINCSYGPCNSKINRKGQAVKGAPGVFFVKFPSPKTERVKCQRWVDACGRRNFTIASITNNSCICSRHFEGFRGPTEDKPDPIPFFNVITPSMIKIPTSQNTLPLDDNLNNPSTSRQSTPSHAESFTMLELPVTVVDQVAPSGALITTVPVSKKAFAPKQICLEKQMTNVETGALVEIELQPVCIANLKPVRGWAFEIDERQASYSKHQDNLRVLQIVIHEEVKCSVKLLAMDKIIPITTIQPCFSLNCNDDIYNLLTKLSQFRLCPGNPDKDMVELYKKRKTQRKTLSHYNEITKTIYSDQCHILIRKTRNRCPACSKYRSSLRKLRLVQNQKVRKETIAKSTAIVKRSKKALLVKAKFSAEHKMMNDLLKEKFENGPKDSLTAIFIKQQMKAMSRSKTGMRWDHSFLKWCCYLKNKSASAYRAMSRSNALRLPSTRTLYRHNHIVSNSSGFNLDFLDHMANDVNIDNLKEHEKYFAILLDEIKIKEDLMCHKATGNLTGFVDISKEYNELDDMNRALNNNTTPPLATHILQLMLRGITTDIIIPFAHFPTDTASGGALHVILWKAVELLEERGFRVLAIVGDGAVSNRKFFKMNSEDSDEEVGHFAVNIFANDEERDIFFISDAPHLIKTTRNAFSTSSSTSKVRHLWINNEEITWNVIIRLYYYQLEAKGEFKHLPNLTYGHVFLDSFSKMKVNYAAQILSEKVACAIETIFDIKKCDYVETVKFIRIFDKFFDLCNVKNCTEARHKRKDSKKPYEDIHDERLRWLEHDFLDYLNNWEAQVNEREGDLKKKDRAKMMLSRETIFGLKMTALSTVRIVRFLLQKGAEYVLTQHLNQDPLEQEFGRHRAAGGRNNNPSVWLYEANIDKLRSLKGFVLEALGGNTSNRE